MSYAPTEGRIYYDIIKWEEKLLSYEPNQGELLFDEALNGLLERTPLHIKEIITDIIDEFLYLIHATMQDHELHGDFCTKVIQSARLFNKDIHEIKDLHKLSLDEVLFVESNETAKIQMYSYAQGATVGLGKGFFTLSDLPALLTLNIRAVQQVATVYGYDLKDPFEHVLALKVVYAALMPKRSQKYYWIELMDVWKEERAYSYMFEGDSVHVDEKVVELLLYEILKLSLISLVKNGNSSVVGMSIGSLVNGQLTKEILIFAKNFYRKRWILEQQ